MTTFRRLTVGAAMAAALLLATAPGASAQTGEVVGGVGLIATDLDPFGLGLQVNGYVAIEQVPNLRVGGDLSFYFPDSETVALPGGMSYQQDVGLLAININGQYQFYSEDAFSLYGLGGLNFSRFSVEFELAGQSESDSNLEVGLNLGVGGHYPVTFGLLFGELKLVTGDADRIVFGGGIRVPFGG